MTDTQNIANIVVIGAGWWTQGWHLPSLHHNPQANFAIVDTSPHPKSNLNPDLESLSALKVKYKTRIFASTDEMLKDIGPELDGVLIATPHATHYEVCRQVMGELDRRKEQGESRSLHILMEKPMSTDIQHAINLYKLVKNHTGDSKFWVNHSANYRVQAKMAREIIASGRLGRVKHVTAFFASPLKWIFEDPECKGWNEPDDGMLGNGFAWGQSSHLFAYLYHICPHLQPVDVFCTMTHSQKTGADVSHSATIRCSDGKDQEYAVMSVSGTTLLPGNAHSHPPVAKKIQVEVFGDEGSLHYEGNDREASSGRLEIRNPDGGVEVVYNEFHFENLDSEGSGPESLQNFVQLCCGNSDVYEGADVMDGLRSIQTIDAMYRSHASQSLENIIDPE
jgi:predicted dehydrogenase